MLDGDIGGVSILCKSPDLMVLLLCGYVKVKNYVPPIPTTMKALKEHLASSVMDIDRRMLLNMSKELDYCWDVSQGTKMAHIEHL